MYNNIKKEIIDLHQFFEDWFNGKLKNTEEDFSRFTKVMGEGFEIISPFGTKTNRSALMEKLRNAYGLKSGSEKKYRIWIENVHTRKLEDNLFLITYKEWQEVDGVTKGRLSTAILKENSTNPNKIEWLHVHETWL